MQIDQKILYEMETRIQTFQHVRTLVAYQSAAVLTAVYPKRGKEAGIIYCGLKIAGEAGEVSEKIGKAMRDEGFPNRNLPSARKEALILELGDVLWYIAAIARELDTSLSTVAYRNLMKLHNRAKQGRIQGSGDNR